MLRNNKVSIQKEFTTIPKTTAQETMDLIYIETLSGFHIALDATYLDQVGNFIIELPTGEIINTANL